MNASYPLFRYSGLYFSPEACFLIPLFFYTLIYE